MRKFVFAALFAAVLFAAYFYWQNSSTKIQSGNFRDANIVLITIDTLRADHLPAYGYSKVKTPSMDRLAAQSILFEDAVAHAPMTLPSHVSILTGLLPVVHGVHDNAGFILNPNVTTLAEVLKQKGYVTAAFVSAFVLDSQFKMDQGFDLYSDDLALAEAKVSSIDLQRRAAETQVEVEAWLRKNKQKKFFLWIHYYDPHDPYDPPEPFHAEYANSLYDGEIAYTDQVLGKLLSDLDSAGLNEKTIVVLTADHGEGLGEHHEKTHSLFIYNATQHVPLMFRLPGVSPGRRSEIVGHVDIVPTLLDLTGIESGLQTQGKSLLPVMNNQSNDVSESVYSESRLSEFHYGWSPLRSITTKEHRFIEAPTAELYDRQTDGAETKNIAKQKPEVVSAMRQKLKEVLQLGAESTPAKVDAETEEKLRALGYVGTTAASTPESRKGDPKDKIEILNALAKAKNANEAQDYPLVISILTPVLEKEPQLVDAHYIAANAYLHLEKMELALHEFLTTIKLKPDHTQALYNIGFYYHVQENLTAAEYWYKQVLKYEPEHLFGNLNLASLYRQKGETEKAKPYLDRIIRDYERSVQNAASPQIRSKLLEKLSEIRFKTGDPAQSKLDLEESTKADPENYEAWWKLGSLYMEARRMEDAARCFEKAIALNAQFYPAYYSLAALYLVTDQKLNEALLLVEKANQADKNKQGEQLRAAILARMKKQ